MTTGSNVGAGKRGPGAIDVGGRTGGEGAYRRRFRCRYCGNGFNERSGTLEDAFRQHYPGFRPANDDQALPKAA